jgi:hypothetical protein
LVELATALGRELGGRSDWGVNRVDAGNEDGARAAATAAGTDVRQSVLERSAQSSKREREPKDEAAEEVEEEDAA